MIQNVCNLSARIFSSTRPRQEETAIGLKWAALLWDFPGLGMGEMFAEFQVRGYTPVSRDWLKTCWMTDSAFLESRLRNAFGMASGPGDLFAASLPMTASTSLLDMGLFRIESSLTCG